MSRAGARGAGKPQDFWYQPRAEADSPPYRNPPNPGEPRCSSSASRCRSCPRSWMHSSRPRSSTRRERGRARHARFDVTARHRRPGALLPLRGVRGRAGLPCPPADGALPGGRSSVGADDGGVPRGREVRGGLPGAVAVSDAFEFRTRIRSSSDAARGSALGPWCAHWAGGPSSSRAGARWPRRACSRS